MEVSHLIALLGALLALSYVAEALFDRTRVPPAVILIGCGVALGPAGGLLPATDFQAVAPYFGALALIAILFEGGLELDLDEAGRGLAAGVVLAVISFLLTGSVLAVLSNRVLGLSWPSAVALGSILGVPSSAVVLPLAGRLGLRRELRAPVVIDAALADVLGIFGVGLAAGVLRGASVPGLVFRQAVVGFGVGVVVAFVFGLLWSRVLRFLAGDRFTDALTFGTVLLLDAAVHLLGGAPAVAVLTFGLVLANEPTLVARLLRQRPDPAADALFHHLRDRLYNFTSQATFIVRTFFFVFLGVVVGWDGLSPRHAILAGVMLAVVVLGRIAALAVVNRTATLGLTASESLTVGSLFPRGLVTAVLAFRAVELSIPGAESFPLYAFLVLVGSNLLMVVGLRTADRGRPKSES